MDVEVLQLLSQNDFIYCYKYLTALWKIKLISYFSNTPVSHTFCLL